MREDLIAIDLFGNEAGEDEPIDILNSYFVEKAEFSHFYDEKNKFMIVSSKKGVGKSALLKKTFSESYSKGSDTISLYIKGSELSLMGEFAGKDPHSLVSGWQQRICSRINFEIGKWLDINRTDDSMTLVESSELAGFRERNIVGALLDRLKLNLLGSGLERKFVEPKNKQALLERVSENSGKTFWLFVDDIDEMFINSDEQKLIISTFFSACRNLVNSVHGLIIRASVRTDVWTILRQYNEALDKCEQYVINLYWTEIETRDILAKKIISYFLRQYPDNKYYQTIEGKDKKNEMIALVFDINFPWAQRRIVAWKAIHIFSNGRPRWAAQIGKLAGSTAHRKNKDKIGISDIRDNMKKYGEARINDLYREHGHQCAKLNLLVECFSKGQRRYNTSELLELVTRRIIKVYGMPTIDGISSTDGSLGICHFLFRIGFFMARDNSKPNDIRFLSYEERPNLLTTTVNLDSNMIWEIHPSYRGVLGIT